MGRKPKSAQTESAVCVVPAPHNQVYLPRNPQEDSLITSLLRAGETLAEPLRDKSLPRPRGPHAQPIHKEETEAPVDLSELLRLLEPARALLEREPRLAQMLAQLPAAFRDETTLRVLCRNLFPELRPSAPQLDNGKPILSRREIEILREAVHDFSHEEIADRLCISPRTVSTHFRNMYQKLGVSKPMQAVTRAIALGYLDLDSVEFTQSTNRCEVRNLSAFDTFITLANFLNTEPNAAPLKSLAQLGLLLMVLSGAAASPIVEDSSPNLKRRGLICELDIQGDIARSFGAEHLDHAGDNTIVVAPPHAALQGFTPGHVFVANRNVAPQGLNSAEILEFTPEGEFVRAFCGGQELITRLYCICDLAFVPDGRLLVTTGMLTDALLAFSDGGATVERFADGCFMSVCVGASGRVYATQRHGIGSIVKVFDPCGRLLQTIGGTLPDTCYGGIVINSRGHVFVARFDLERDYVEEYDGGCIEVYDKEGKFDSSFHVPDWEGGRFACDAQDRLYIPCNKSGVVTIFSPIGEVLKEINLRGKLSPYSVAIGAAGQLWVYGNVA